MTVDDFRSMALGLPETLESAHMSHPDFRVRGKIFATLWPDQDCGVLKLTPEQQQVLIREEPQTFQPVNGAWGARGATKVRLPTAPEDVVRRALLAAWRNTAPKRLLRQFEDG